ncbi:hypothetical protein QZM92_18310 [Burkholderia multivorans]|uniref:hypothetical protein n=1 Tax=Burkholderia multivorans TaxID=87883 RepID=UPI0015E3A0D7|nr:hypothetical protein [Burkholderia multivorans]MBU9574070.1 hypothetical protein [Burkholderia multivorans]MDN7963965.1 hypothetical protein [Burkholderia multivorans]
MQHAKQHDIDSYFEVIEQMDIANTIRHGRTVTHIGTLEDEPVTGIYHEAEGVGFIIY